MSDIMACCACLATDVKLYDVGEDIQTVTGSTVESDIPPYLCMKCHSDLQSSLDMRYHCVDMQKTLYLWALDQLLTKEQIQLLAKILQITATTVLPTD